MRREFFAILFLCVFWSAAVLSSQVTVAGLLPDESARRIPGQVIVQVNSSKSASQLATDFSSVGLRPSRLLSQRLNIWLYEFATTGAKAASDPDRLLTDLRRHPGVELAQFNHTIDLRSTFPNDPSFSNQWGLHNTGQTGGAVDADIDAPEAWDLGTAGATAAGDPIVIAVIDAGCDLNHTDIAYFKNMAEIPNNALDDDNNGYVDDYHGWNATQGNGNVTSSDHGTHVAGIAAAKGNNLTGVTGVNWNVQVMPVVGSTLQEAVAVAAYAYALEMRAVYNESDGAAGAFVVATNSSFGVDFGDPENYPIWCAMYDSLGAYGVLSAGAAPNIHLDVDIEGDIPTACPSDYLISVTNTTSSDLLNASVGYGLESIDLGAPGTSVYSTLQGGGYGYKTGASMATPHVAGAIGYLYSIADLDLMMLARVRPDSVALLIKQAILGAVDPLPALNGISVSGGRLNLHQAALAAQSIAVGLTILHDPLPDSRDTLNPYAISAVIFSDTLLLADSLLLHYEINSVSTSVLMTPGPDPDEYTASIPAQLAGTTVSYLITAVDEAGQTDTAGPYIFSVIDYALALRPTDASAGGLIGDTVWQDLWIINDGLVPDSYALTISGADWSAVLFDSSHTVPLTSTPIIPPGDSLRFSIGVLVPQSRYLDRDSTLMEALSSGSPGLAAAVVVETVSDGSSIPLPFAETFPEIFIDTLLWARIVEVGIDDIGIGEPSPIYSLHLNGNRFGADTIISTAIDLAGHSAIHFRYAWQRTGGGDSPEPGDDLVIDYLDSTGQWNQLARIPGDGPDMSAFTNEEISLPPDAFHRRFRFRVHCSGTVGSYDDWFVDNIAVEFPPPYGVALTPSPSIRSGSAGSAVDHCLTLRNRGASNDQYSLITEALGGWPLQVFDSSGTSLLTTTPTLAPGDSLHLLVRVIIPANAPASTINLSRLIALSATQPVAADTASIETTSDGPAGTLPWFESFPSDTVDTQHWFSLGSASISSVAAAPPSAPFALRLDGSVDTVVSQTIDLFGASGVILTYHYQKGADEPPDAGDDFWIEYQDTTGAWILLDHVLGDGVATGKFVSRSIVLDSDALHSAFRFRLRSFGSCSTCDLWFVDNIRIDFSPTMFVDPLSISAALNRGDSLPLTLIVTNEGPGALDYTLTRSLPAASPPGALSGDEISREPARRSYPEGFSQVTLVKGQNETRIGHPVMRDAGGPDENGYIWTDSDDPLGPTFNWTDIGATGTDITSELSDDNFSGPHPIGFAFPFYDFVYTELYVGSNGIIGFSSVDMDSRINTSLPNATTPNGIIAWMWDDLDPNDADNPDVSVQIDSSSDRCILQFTNYPEYDASPGDVITAQVELMPNGKVNFRYLGISPGFTTSGASIGIEGPDGADGLEVAYLTPYLHDSLAIRFENPFAWLHIIEDQGTVAPEAADTIDLILRSADLDSGFHLIDLVISSNDPTAPPIVVPVQLSVQIPIAYLCGDLNGDWAGPNVADLTYLVNFLFRAGPPPAIIASGDVNNSGGSPNVSDLTYLVAYLFRGGPPPTCPPE